MMERLPPAEAPLRDASPYYRALPRDAALSWLRAGFDDFRVRPALSLAYGVVIFLLSAVVLGGLWRLGLHYMILPALGGFLVIGPLLAIGLYEKSRRIAAGEPLSLRAMMFVRPRSGGQVAFAGMILCLLMMLWLLLANLLYALFFGMLPFPGFDRILQTLLTTSRGWALIVTGSAVGSLFAAFAMAISIFSIPALTETRTDVLTAMGESFALTNRNLVAVLPWGLIVTVGFAICFVTALVGLIVVFPVLGHGTWRAWHAVQRPAKGGVSREEPGAGLAPSDLEPAR